MKTIIILLLLPLALLMVPASHAKSTVTTVTISGQVNIDGVTVLLRADASGTLSSLSGFGTDSPPPNSPPGNPAACQFPLTGSASGGTVTLSGSVTQSSVLSNIGTPVKIIAVQSTGAITFDFGTATLTGSGTVVITTR